MVLDKHGNVDSSRRAVDEAASDAIRDVRFRPARQRERAVGVWISIPVNFRLKS